MVVKLSRVSSPCDVVTEMHSSSASGFGLIGVIEFGTSPCLAKICSACSVPIFRQCWVKVSGVNSCCVPHLTSPMTKYTDAKRKTMSSPARIKPVI